MAEKSTLWTDTGVDQNFQRDLGAIGPYEFQGNSYGPMAPSPYFQDGSSLCGKEMSAEIFNFRSPAVH